MKDIGEGTIRRIDWQELTPAVLLLRIFNTATGIRVLFLSMIGILLTLIVGYTINSVHNNNNSNNELTFYGNKNFQEPVYIEPFLDLQTQTQKISFWKHPAEYSWQLVQRSVFVPWDIFSQAGMQLFRYNDHSFFISAGWFLALLFIWSFFGGMICRTVALRLTIDQSESGKELWQFIKQRGTGFLSAIMIIVLGMLFCLIFLKLCGWLFTVPILDYLTAILFPIVLIVGFVIMALAIALFFGWSLLFAAVSVDGSDGFDAVSRMFSYLYQRPFHYFVYWVLSGILGVLGFVFVSFFVDGIIILISSRFGGFPDQTAIPAFGYLTLPETYKGLSPPENLILIWCGMVQLIKPAYTFAWFWASSVAIYLLLRRSVDATPLNEVYRLAPVKPRTLPELTINQRNKNTNNTESSR
ncbi:MAG: hypothetical protein LBI18_15400 [Planctomycetaceae bacterium]|jgi:hypothetical protein|nr:hypothetical protein [Planctomycetaceae bacterium]